MLEVPDTKLTITTCSELYALCWTSIKHPENSLSLVSKRSLNTETQASGQNTNKPRHELRRGVMNNEFSKGFAEPPFKKIVGCCLRGEEATENGGVSKGVQEPAGCRHESPGFAGQNSVLPLGVKLWLRWWEVLRRDKATRIALHF